MALFGNIFGIFAGFLLPIAAGVWLSLRKKGYLKPVLLGAATFFVFQMLTRIPLLQLVLPGTMWFTLLQTSQPVLYALFLGGTAALFEEGGRWLVMTLFMKNKSRPGDKVTCDSVTCDGIAFGVGHGGIEAVFILGITAIYTLASGTPTDLFWGGFERVCTMVVHIAWSVMVLKSVTLKKPVWLLAAFLLHTVIDMAAVLMMQAGASALVMESVVFVFALAMLAYILMAYHTQLKKQKGANIQ